MLDALVSLHLMTETIDAGRIERDLAPTNLSFASEERATSPRVASEEPGLHVGEFREPGDLHTARAFAARFRDRHDVTIWLDSAVQGHPAPGFNGVLRDRDGHALANLKLTRIQTGKAEVLDERVATCLDKMIRFGEVAGWRRNLMKYARQAAGLSRGSEVDAVTLDERGLERYRSKVVKQRALMNLFAPGTGRPAWLLVYATHPNPLAPITLGELERLSMMLPNDSALMILQGGRLTTFRGGRRALEDSKSCDSRLVEPASVPDARRNPDVRSR